MVSRFTQLRAGSLAATLLVAAILAPASRADSPAPVAITFAHINDVYEIDGVDGGRAGGLARVATVVDRLRRQGPVLFTLGGDFLSPSPIGSARLEGQAIAGRQMVEVLNAAGLQWTAIGNHEFDVGEPAFKARLGEATFGVVATNVSDLAGVRFPKTVSSAIVPIRAGGRTLRIGLVGLTIDTPPRPWVRYVEPIAAARTEVASLRGRVDAIVALTHLAMVGDQALVEAIPEIDLVLGGHEHENWMAQRGGRFTPIIKADANARTMAIVRMEFGASGDRPTVSSRLQVIDRATTPKPSIDRLAKRWVQTAYDAYRREGFQPERVIATTPEPLDARESVVRARPSLVTDIVVAGVMREAGLPDVAIVNGGSVRMDDVLPAGPVTEYDAIRLLPFGNKVLSMTLRGDLLTDVLDAGQANAGSGGYLHVFGAQRTATGWTVAGQPIDPMRAYRAAMPDFLLTGGEMRLAFLTRTNPQVQDVREHRDMRAPFIEELRRRYP